MEEKVEVQETDVVPKQCKVRNVSRDKCEIISAISLKDLKEKAARIFNQSDMPQLQVDADGTIVEDDDYFRYQGDLDFVAVFENEKWIDSAKYIVETSKISADMTDGVTVYDDERLRKVISYLLENAKSVYLLSEPDLEMIENMSKKQLEGVTVSNGNFKDLKEIASTLLYQKRRTAESIQLVNFLYEIIRKEEEEAKQQQEGDESTSNADNTQQTSNNS